MPWANDMLVQERENTHMKWNQHWDLDSIPTEILFSHVQTRRARLSTTHTGRGRSCGHTKWIKSCDVCKRNFKRTQYRIAKGLIEPGTKGVPEKEE